MVKDSVAVITPGLYRETENILESADIVEIGSKRKKGHNTRDNSCRVIVLNHWRKRERPNVES